LFYLIGFEQIRLAKGRALLRGDAAWQKNIYQHPSRQSISPEEAYRMQHDIHSLGVCLLEIGLWGSFVVYSEDGQVAPGKLLGFSQDDIGKMGPSAIEERFVTVANAELPRVMGELYTGIVVNCLTCLDADNLDFGNAEEFQDEDGVFVRVRYIEKVSCGFLH
jgi:hypothetical protein